MNRAILDKVRCMMLNSGVPKSFWGEAVMIICYLINLTSTAAFNGDTPNEKLSGQLNDYSVFRTFGYAAFSH